MSYPRDLEDYSDVELAEEIMRRARNRAIDRCDYCGKTDESPACKYPQRHTTRRDPSMLVRPLTEAGAITQAISVLQHLGLLHLEQPFEVVVAICWLDSFVLPGKS